MEKEGHCFICKERISNWARAETFTEVGKSITVHKGCIPVFRSFVLKSVGEEVKREIEIVRPLSFVEFLREKEPKNEAEILACLAYFLEQRVEKRLELTVDNVKEHLKSAGSDISDISTAFIRARERRGFFERVSTTPRHITHRLTRTGAKFVEKLPERE